MKTAVVTGGEHGLGLALSSLLVNNGFVVFSLDVKRGKTLFNKFFLKTNISKEADLLHAFNKINGVDLLVCNAGIMKRGSLFDLGVKDFDEVFSVNVKGSWLTLKCALSKLNNSSKVLLISSRHSSLPYDPGLYGLSKKNVEHLGVLFEKEPLVVRKKVVVKTTVLGPFKSDLSMTGFSKKSYSSRKDVEDVDVVAKKVFDFISSKKKLLLFNVK